MYRFMKRIFLLLPILACLFFANCEKPDQAVRQGYMSFEASGLEKLPEGLVYKLWLVNDSSYSYITVLDPDENGFVSIEDRSIDDILLQEADELAVSIETQGSANTMAGPILIAGDWGGGFDSLNMGHSSAFNDNFTTVSGLFQIISPTTLTHDDSVSGIWFYDTTGVDTFTLNLPELSEGWSYEAWLHVNDLYLSMGRFKKSTEADDANVYSGPEETLHFPGEDFVTNAPSGLTFPLDVRTHELLISIEPKNDTDSQHPFYLIPLRAVILDDALPGELNDLFKLDFVPPSGSAKR